MTIGINKNLSTPPPPDQQNNKPVTKQTGTDLRGPHGGPKAPTSVTPKE